MQLPRLPGYVLKASVLWLLALAPFASSEQFPIHIFSTMDGLAHNRVNRIRGDSKGFIWFCTDAGLSRWNGYEFQSYTRSDGLPHAHINDFLETRRGEYWIATDGGLVRFYPGRKSAFFVTYFSGASSLSRAVNVLLEDSDGTVLAGTADGLYRLHKNTASPQIVQENLGLESNQRDGSSVNTLLLTRDGRLWVGTGSGIYVRGLDGLWDRLKSEQATGRAFLKRSNGLPDNYVTQLREGPDGRVWAATREGLVQLADRSVRTESMVANVLTRSNSLPSNEVRDFLISNDRHIWVATTKGLAEGSLGGPPGRIVKRFQSLSILQGFADETILSLAGDPVGDLWLTCHWRISRASQSLICRCRKVSMYLWPSCVTGTMGIPSRPRAVYFGDRGLLAWMDRKPMYPLVVSLMDRSTVC